MPKLNKIHLPLIPVRGLVIFPKMVLHFDVARPKSIAALECAMATNQLVFLTAQEDVSLENPTLDDMYPIGTVAKIKQLLKLPGDSVRVLVEGLYRGELRRLSLDEPYFEAEIVERKSRDNLTDESFDAIARRLHELLDDYLDLNPRMAPEALVGILDEPDGGVLADTLASNLLIRTSDKQAVLKTLDVEDRLIVLIEILSREIKVLEIEESILDRVHGQIDKNNREYFLREQVKAIRQELGEDEDGSAEADEYREKLAAKSLPADVAEKAQKELSRLAKMAPQSAESAVIRGWLDLVLELPWDVKTEENHDISAARSVLERDHYGLEKVKERIVEYLAVRELSDNMKSAVLCLVGPPGVGKTSIAKSIAEATGRKYVRMSLGGVRDEAEIRGHRRTYIGAICGRIISAIRTAGAKNALVLLDEIDKMNSDAHGDPAAAMLEVLDAEQNFAFRDHYLELPFDLSDVMFVTTANSQYTIPRPLLDRMEVIELSGYTDDEKSEIAHRYLIPKQMEKHGLKASQLKIADGAVTELIESYTREAGVRNLEREIASVCRKAATMIVEGRRKSVTVTAAQLPKLIGLPKYRREETVTDEQVGVVTGLAWTEVGGETLSIEVNVMDGTGKVELTGNLGAVMKESAQAAMSFIRSYADELGIDKDFYKKFDIHIHIPEGATPKDGPSAGVTIATALASALSKRAVRSKIAMTGEITIRGRVLAIGGLKEKTLAALREGINTVFIPAENKSDLSELPKKVTDAIKFVPVTGCDEILRAALLPMAKKHPKKLAQQKKTEAVTYEYS